ncbi:MAG: zinc metalloprotease HtpX [Beijerinckiaceae bacterium]
MNFFKTSLLLAALTALFGVVGLSLGGFAGMIIALLFAVITNAFAYWNADKMALAAHSAQEVTVETAPDLVRMVHALAQNAGLPPPRVYIVHESQPNAFATGRNPANAAVAATTGLIDLLTPEELAGVMAHELAHIRNHDTLIMTVAATVAGAISSLMNFAYMFGGNRNRPNPLATMLLVILAPMAAGVIQMAISRSREYVADRMGAEICGNPVWLARALEKISGGVARIPNESAEMRPATAPLFIINPLSGRRMDNLFSTHPATANRIEALMQQASEMGLLDAPQQPTRGPWSR